MSSEFLLGGCQLYFRGMCTEIRIRNIFAVSVRKAKMHPHSRSGIQLIGRRIITQPIAAVIRKPQRPRIGVPIKTDGIPNTAGKNLRMCSIGFYAHDARIARVFLETHIAWRAHRHIKLAIGPKADKFPPVMRVLRKKIRYFLSASILN